MNSINFNQFVLVPEVWGNVFSFIKKRIDQRVLLLVCRGFHQIALEKFKERIYSFKTFKAAVERRANIITIDRLLESRKFDLENHTVIGTAVKTGQLEVVKRLWNFNQTGKGICKWMEEDTEHALIHFIRNNPYTDVCEFLINQTDVNPFNLLSSNFTGVIQIVKILLNKGRIDLFDGCKEFNGFIENNFRIKGDGSVDIVIQNEGNDKEVILKLRGLFKNGKLNGEGEIIFKGEFIKGNFQNGELNGEGEIGLCIESSDFKFNPALFWKGIFEKGKLEGQGIYEKKTVFQDFDMKSYKEYEKYEGEFKNHEFNGQGKSIIFREFNSEKEIVKKGKFKNGLIIQGKINFYDVFIGDGDFNRDLLVKGKRIFSNGLIEEGEFADGVLIKGKKNFLGGLIEEGEFDRSRLIKGRITHPNGVIDEGDFDWISRLLIKGKIIFPKGVIFEGEFTDGVLIKGRIRALDIKKDI